MSDFDRWFLLAYTAYMVFAVAALMWVGRDASQHPLD
jgi:hypothetical protein